MADDQDVVEWSEIVERAEASATAREKALADRVALEVGTSEIPGEPGWTPPVLFVEPPTMDECIKLLSGIQAERTRSQLVLMRLRSAQAEAELDYKRAHLQATTDPRCPVVGKHEGMVTVAERNDWIEAVEFEEYAALTIAKKRTRNVQEWIAYLEEQQSGAQSILQGVKASFFGAEPQGGRR